MRQEGLATILRVIVKLNLQSETALQLAEKILLTTILPLGAPIKTADALNLCYSLVA